MKFENKIKCTRDVNVITLNLKTTFPITCASFFQVARKGWGGSVPIGYLADQGPIVLRPGGLPFSLENLPKTQNFITNNFWDRFHVRFSDLLRLRNQEMGV